MLLVANLAGLSVLATTTTGAAQCVLPNDRHYPPQWGLHQTGAHLAWSITAGSTQVTTGILDQGIDYTHPDLYLNVWIANVTPEELEHSARVTPPASRYATANGAHVSNNSYGAPVAIIPPDILEAGYDAIEEAAAAGHLMVFAVENDGLDNDLVAKVPISFGLPNMIAVANTAKNDHLYKTSDFGSASVHLGAPGTKVLTTGRAGGNAKVTGTSFSAPHVVGAAALALAANPALDLVELKALLLAAVDPAKDLEGLTVTGGRLNVGRAVAAAVAP